MLQREKMTKMVLKDFFTETSQPPPAVLSQKQILSEVAVLADDVLGFLIDDLVDDLVIAIQ